MQQLIEQIKTLANQYFNEVIAIRRHLHQHPELSFKEYETSAFIKKQLEHLGIDYTDGYVQTGIVARIHGKNPKSKTIGLRADMDALPIQEKSGVAFESINAGVMHACGHDIHTASLLGTAMILNNLKEAFEGTVLLIFQPGEEKLPGGAKLMMDEGALDNPKPQIIIGQHVMPGLEAGKVGFRPGMYMASADEIYLTVKGKGGHAAMPHQLVDTILLAAQIIVNMQQVVSRNAPAAIPSVLSFGKIEGLGATNVIPETVHIAGTFRTMNEEWRTEAHQRITQIAKGIAQSMDGSCEVDIQKGYPFLVNDPRITEISKLAAQEILGAGNTVNLDLRMTAEDFAYFSQQYPSTFYRLGIADKKHSHPLHSPYFSANEEALRTGIKTMSWLAIKLLQESPKT